MFGSNQNDAALQLPATEPGPGRFSMHNVQGFVLTRLCWLYGSECKFPPAPPPPPPPARVAPPPPHPPPRCAVKYDGALQKHAKGIMLACDA